MELTTKCVACNGTGLTDKYKNLPSYHLNPETYLNMLCDKCGGCGQEESQALIDLIEMPCPQCKGLRKVGPQTQPEYHRLDCPGCHGIGKLLTPLGQKVLSLVKERLSVTVLKEEVDIENKGHRRNYY